MEQVANTILQTIQSNGGKCDWNVILDAVGYENRRLIPAAMEHLETTGQAKRVNYKHPERGWIMDVQLVGGA